MEPIILDFPDRQAWRDWLETHHAGEAEAWVRHHKKASSSGGLRYAEAVEEALCFGWIDSKMRSMDKDTFVQRYSPRRPTSIWSANNRARVEALIEQGRMEPAGLAVVAEAKRRGSWGRAHTDLEPTPIPPDLEQALGADAVAWQRFRAFANSYRNQYVYWVETARKAETRKKRIDEVVRRAGEGQKPG